MIPAFFSTDVYYYGNVGWQQVAYHANPYVHSVNEIPNWKSDPMFFPTWENVPSLYGFLFSEISYAAAWLGGGHRALTAMLFKLINVAAFVATGWLVWRGCKFFRLPNPERALYLFLWNPLLLLHFLSDGHNDLLMGLCTAAGILWVIERGWLLAVPLLMAGMSIKHGSAIVLPFLLLYIGKRYGKTRAAIGLALGCLLWAAAAAPYLVHDGGHLAFGRIAQVASWWCPYTLSGFLFFPYDVASQLSPTLAAFKPQAMAAIKLVLWTGFAGFYLGLLAVRLRGPYSPAKLLYDSLLVQFVVLCFVSCKFYPWYFGMFLPLAYWLPAGDRLRCAVLAVACAQVIQFTCIRNMNGIQRNRAVARAGRLCPVGRCGTVPAPSCVGEVRGIRAKRGCVRLSA